MRWSPATRIAFRFCFVYFGLYSLATQISGGLFLLPGLSFPGFGLFWPMRQITTWVAVHLLGITAPLIYTGNSGDTNFFWAQTFWLLMVSLLATSVWSLLDRRRAEYVTLHKWFRLFLRFAVASQMFDYGMAKVIPTQMPAPALITLVEPLGSLSLQGLLWTSIGASQPYEIFTGLAEVVGGLLLLVPRTTVLGAITCLAVMIQVFVLNMTYDIGIKLISFHLTLMILLLLAPEFRRLANFFVLDRPVAPSNQPQLFHTPRANRAVLMAQVVFGLYLLAMYTSISTGYWYAKGGGGSPKSPLYGIWNVQQLAIDGQLRPAELNDYDRRWRRVIFDDPDVIVFQRTDDSFARYGVSIDVTGKTLALTKTSRNWASRFAFERPTADRLILDGEMDGHRIHARLQLVEFDTFRLLDSTFRWVRPPDP